MDNFTFCSPTYFSFGKGTENSVGELVKKFGGSKVLVHYGSNSAQKSGLIDRVTASLKKENIPYVLLGGVQPNPRSSLVYKGIELCRKENVDFILAVGGGSAIDSSKAIAGGVLYDGDFWDHHCGVPIEKALPVGTVLTIAAAGSEGSGNTVITHENGMLKRGCRTEILRPKFSVLNPELTCTLPSYQTACGITDILAHLYERYLTDSKEVEVTDRLIEALMLTVINQGKKVIDNPKDYEARANIMWAGTLAHNNVCGVGRTQDWNSHALEHELSGLYDCAHGAGLAVVMPAMFKYVMKKNVMLFAQVAVRVWGCSMDFSHPENTALEGIEKLQQFLSYIGMPKNFAELEAKEEDIPYLAHTLCYGNGRTGTVSGYIDITEDVAKEIYNLML
ncbi:MAG: iron-containing alcohol dehydrogenase [Acutalibacteraceae bacterium]|nr:iron-containing alcohol dehydrogenase [Acutalibacteraceae bacterium]